MLIVAKQDNINNLFAIWNTITHEFLGTNLEYDECVEQVMEYKDCSYEDAENVADHPQPFDDIAKHIRRGFEPDCAEVEPVNIKDAARAIVSHYKSDEHFRNAFICSIASALKEIPIGAELHFASKVIADRIMGDE